MEDTEIIELFWLRNEQAIRETDEKYGGRCRSVSCGIVSDPETAEECVNDSYLALWNAVPPERPRFFPAFLFRIVRNISFDRLRARLAAKRGGGEGERILGELDACLASDFSVERELETKELAAEISRFLHTLPREDRLIFSYRYWLMLPVAEVAARLDRKENTVKSSLHRSRKKLHAHLMKEGLL